LGNLLPSRLGFEVGCFQGVYLVLRNDVVAPCHPGVSLDLKELRPDTNLCPSARISTDQVIILDNRFDCWLWCVRIERSKHSLWCERVGNDIPKRDWSMRSKVEVRSKKVSLHKSHWGNGCSK